jgi:hypothetical protein
MRPGVGVGGEWGDGVTKDNILQASQSPSLLVPKSPLPLTRVEKHPCYDEQDYSSSPS